jgi:alpha-glucosidase
MAVYSEVSVGKEQVVARGSLALAMVQSTAPGVMRVRLAPAALRSLVTYPDFPAKQSFAVSETRPGHPLTVTRGDVVRIEGAECALSLSLADGSFTFTDGQGRCLATAIGCDGQSEAAYPVDRHRARITLAAPAGEAYLGFGEKVGPLDKRGMRFTFWNTDCFPPEPHTDPLYASIPFFIAIQDGVAWGLFLDESARSRVDVAATDEARLTWEVEGPELDVYLFTGQRPADVLRRYVELTGRPFMPPLFALGAQQSRWGYENADEVMAVVNGHRARELPLDVVYLDIDHMDGYKVFTWDRARFPDPPGLVRTLGERGVRLITIVDPGVKMDPAWEVYQQARDKDYLVRLDRGGVLTGEVWPDPAAFPDFSRQEVRSWWASLHHAHIDAGVAGIWNDMNEPSCFSLAESRGIPAPDGSRSPGYATPLGKTLPDEARHGTRRHLEVHNAYALGMAQAAFEAQAQRTPGRRPFVLTRAGFAGIQKFAALWTGDFGSYWSHLDASLPMLQGLGVSGLPFVGADVPGFVGDASGELLVRWTQAGIFAPLLRNHSAKGTLRQEPWRFGEPCLSLVRSALELRYRLLPALYTYMAQAHESGLPPMRPLVFEHPGDSDALAAFDQFLFGDGLLVAPVVRAGQTKRMVYLPRGEWLPLGPGLSGEEVLTGGRHVVADAPLDRVPLYLAAGHGLTVTEPALHTASAEWPALDWHLHVDTDGHARAALYEDRGDGAFDGTWSRVTVERTDGQLRVSRWRSGPGHARRQRERVILHGVDAPRNVQGTATFRHHGRSLVLEVPADWSLLAIL